MSKQRRLHIVMAGPSLSSRGGMMSVQRLILANAPGGLRITHLPTHTFGSAASCLAIFIVSSIRLAFLCLPGGADIVHLHFNERGSTIRKTLLSCIALLARRPLILHSHSANFDEFFASVAPWIRTIVVFVFKKCTRFISLSEKWDDYYKKTFGFRSGQTVVLYNPVELPAVVPDRRCDTVVTFAFLGLIGPRSGVFGLDKDNPKPGLPRQDKGAYDLLRAFAALPASDRARARLFIAGPGEVGKARLLSGELGIADRVEINSWLEPDERDTALRKASVFVLPSYCEGLPMAMLEAMAWGLPVLVTPVGGIPEFIVHEREGLLVKPGDGAAIGAALSRFINDAQFRIDAGKRARERVAALSVTRYMPALLDVYAGAAASRPAAPDNFQKAFISAPR